MEVKEEGWISTVAEKYALDLVLRKEYWKFSTVNTIILGDDVDISPVVGSNQLEILRSVTIDGSDDKHSIIFDQTHYGSQFGRPAIRAMEGDIVLKNLKVVLIPGADNDVRDNNSMFAQGVKVEAEDVADTTGEDTDGVCTIRLESVDIILLDQYEVGNANTAGLGVHIDPDNVEQVDVEIKGFNQDYYGL